MKKNVTTDLAFEADFFSNNTASFTIHSKKTFFAHLHREKYIRFMYFSFDMTTVE